jgi:hypothetical protein
MTPRRSALTPRSCPPSLSLRTTCAASAIWATKAKPTHHRGVQEPKDSTLTGVQQQFNNAHNGVRAIGERGNTLLKMTFKALRNVSLCPWTIGRIAAAALVLLHVDHGRTT